MSDAGGYAAITGLNLYLSDFTFSQQFPAYPLPNGGPLFSGDYQPTNIADCDDFSETFPAPAPTPSGSSALSVFNGTNPNGTWSLYVVDDTSGNIGSVSGGWGLMIVAGACPSPTPIPSPTSTPGPTHFRIDAPSYLPIPGPVTFTVTALDASNQIVNYVGTMHFTSSNPFAQLPGDSGLTGGTGTFTANFGQIFVSHTITATDTGNFHVTGTSNCVVLGDMTPTPTATPTATPTPTAAPTGTPLPTPCGVTFSENFDGVTAPSLPAGWTTAAVGAVPWQTSTTNAASAPNDAFAFEADNVGNTELITPMILAPATGGILSFQNLFNLHANPIPGPGWDGMVLEISINGGAYVDIITAGGGFFAGGYTHTIAPGFGNPIAGRMAWSGLSGGTTAAPTYITTTISLPATANGQNIKLKWRVATDSMVRPGGVRIDSVVLTPASCATPTPTPTATGTPSPTPTPAGPARALNLSTRLHVETGNNVGIGGFIITGSDPRPVLLRGIGPSLVGVGAATG